MPEKTSFTELLARVRAGDENAATELVRTHEPALRRWVRFRLGDSGLARALDSMDICQSVLASFFVRAAAGQYDLAGPEDLIKLLVTMARNKLAMQHRRQRTKKRDVGRLEDMGVEEIDPGASQASPSRVVASRELLEEVRRRLSPEEQRMAELRSEGENWGTIAARLGGTADARRMQMTRALDRIAAELGLDDGSDEG